MTQEQWERHQRNLAKSLQPVCEQLRKIGKQMEAINHNPDFQRLVFWYRR